MAHNASSGAQGVLQGGTAVEWLRTIVWRMRRCVILSVLGIVQRGAIAACTFRRIHGISVGDADAPQAAARLLKVEQALSLIAEVDPRRLQRISSDLRRILVLPAAKAHLWERSLTCVIPQSLVERDSASLVALRVVHEATHARLTRAGVRFLPERIYRMEVLCVQEEIRLASLLPLERFPSRNALVEELRGIQERHGARIPGTKAV